MLLNFRLLKEARLARNIIILSICLSLIGGTLTIIQAHEINSVINQIFLERKTLSSVYSILITVLIVILVRVSFVWAGEISAVAAASRIKVDLRKRFFTHILELGPANFNRETVKYGFQTGELVNLETEGIDSLEVYFSQYLPQIALAALIPLIILIFVFPSDHLSGIVLLVTAPLMPIFMVLIGSTAENLTRKQWRGLSRMSGYFLDVLQGLTTLKALGRSKDQIEIIKKVSENYRQSTMSVLKVTFLSSLALELIATLSTAVVAVEVGIRLLYGRMPFEQAFFILLLAPEFYVPLRLLGARFHSGMSGVEASKRIFEILDFPAKATSQRIEFHQQRQKINHAPPSIIIKDVKFSYEINRPALQGVALEIPAGKMTALIGESGAGKSTLSWLLLGFIHPQSGEIIVDGKQLDEIPIAEWRENLAWVSQNPFLFNDTVMSNIKLAKPKADPSAILHAARLAHVDEFIQDLPLGYDTQIGERGTRLSAGQAQRIALARAFLKDAPFLILDEATSHLDPEVDDLLQESFEHLSHDRTVLVIAHHQATLAQADQVIKLSKGRVVQVDVRKSAVNSAPGSQINSLPIVIPRTETDAFPVLSAPRPENINQSPKISITRQFFNLLSPFIGRIILSVSLGFATIASGVGLMATAAYIISAAALHPSIAELQVAIVGVRFFGLSRGVFRYLERLVSHDVTFRLLARWRVWFYQALEPLAPSRLMRYHSADLLTRVISDIGTLESFYVRTIAPPLVALLASIAMSMFMGSYGAQLAWALMGFWVLAGIGLPMLIFLLTHQLGQQILAARSQLNTFLIDGIQGMADILICGQAEDQIERVGQAGDQLTHLQARMSRITVLQAAMGNLLANLGLLTVLTLAIQSVSLGQLNGVFLGVIALSALTCFEAMQPLPLVAQNLEANQAAARRLYELVDAPPPVVDPINPIPQPEDNSLDIHDLSFNYPQSLNNEPDELSSQFGLHDILFSLPPAQHIAVIGPNGSGKTTLTNLLLRFWDYQHGSIHLGKHELKDYRQEVIRNQIAIVPQTTYLFSATIKENLLIAHPQATDDEILQATKLAQLHEFIQSLPDKYDTWIGEHGLRLSAGERQRLAIARALLKGSPLLILDEPTANLDPATELAVLDSISKFSEASSVITITQRMVNLEAMDEIIVLKNGTIVEHGSHNQLISNHGLYNRVWELYHQIL